jgi:hypothetical protein
MHASSATKYLPEPPTAKWQARLASPAVTPAALINFSHSQHFPHWSIRYYVSPHSSYKELISGRILMLWFWRISYYISEFQSGWLHSMAAIYRRVSSFLSSRFSIGTDISLPLRAWYFTFVRFYRFRDDFRLTDFDFDDFDDTILTALLNEIILIRWYRAAIIALLNIFIILPLSARSFIRTRQQLHLFRA